MKEKDTQTLAEKISKYARDMRARYPTGSIIVSEDDLAGVLHRAPEKIAKALGLLQTQQKVERAPLAGYWETQRRIRLREKPQGIARESREELPTQKKGRLPFHMLQCFQLEHPENEMVLCDRPKCEAIADYLEVEADGSEHRLCAFHTMSEKYASRLPVRAPDPNTPYRALRII